MCVTGRGVTLGTSVKVHSTVYLPASLSFADPSKSKHAMGERKGGVLKTLQGSLYHSSTALQSHPMNGHYKRERNFPKSKYCCKIWDLSRLSSHVSHG